MALTVLAAVAATACSSSGGASADAGVQPDCIFQEAGSVYVCTGGGTSPACPASVWTYQPKCAVQMSQCMGCDDPGPGNSPGAGIYCVCQASGDAGPTWLCAGTEHTCR